ncbi:MAG: YlbF family regulator [Gammaproteobacteria bacterium]|nr:YlbF family regulator [Gammaproteobacteria bacterium]
MDTTLILSDTYELIDEIKETKEYKLLKNSYEALYSNEEAKLLIEDFNLKKEAYKNNSEDKEVIKALSISKTNLYNNPLYKAYENALRDYNKMMGEIEMKINNSIYKENVRRIAKSGHTNHKKS